MKPLKVVITLEMVGDENDMEMLRESVYSELKDLLDEECLEFDVFVEDEDEDS